MDLPVNVAGIDMNDRTNLSFYTQLIRFQGSAGEAETTFLFPNNPQQRMIQSWAHDLGFAFEYSIASQSGRVVKSALPEPIPDVFSDLDFLGFDSTTEMGSENFWPSGRDMISEDLNRMNTSQSLTAVELGYSLTQLQHDMTTREYTHSPALFDLQPEMESSTFDHDGNFIRNECGPNGLYEGTINADDNLWISGQLSSEHLKIHEQTQNKHSDEIERLSYQNSELKRENEALRAHVYGASSSSGHLVLAPQLEDRPSSVGPISSVDIDRGRKRVREMFSRKPSLQSPASSTFQEYVFDSRSPRTGSPASAASGRRGILDAATNAAAKAVKAIRACWR